MVLSSATPKSLVFFTGKQTESQVRAEKTVLRF